MDRATQNRLNEYHWQAEHHSDHYEKDWLSNVTIGECGGATTLGAAMHEYTPETDRKFAGSVVRCMGHLFGRDLTCGECGIAWEDHQRTKSQCDRYIEAENAPREEGSGQYARAERLKRIYGWA